MKIKHLTYAPMASFKKSNCLLLSSFSFMLFMSCSDSTSDEFNNINGDVKEKQIKQVSVVSTEYPADDIHLFLAYNEDDRLTSISSGEGTTTFNYEGNKLSNVGGDDSDAFNIEELYKSPYDAFGTGHVTEYDDNGNPSIIKFYEEEYNYETQSYEPLEFTAEVSYDDVHNPYYYTLKSAGIIEILDKVELDFGATSQSSKIVKARLLFPVNNPSKIVYKNELGVAVYQIVVDYVYDQDNYPISATVVETSFDSDDEDEIYTFNSNYIYRQ